MTTENASEGAVEKLYRLESVDSAPAPDNGDGNWYRYVIVQGSNRIVGLRSGSLTELHPILEDMVNKLNERAGKQLAKSKK